VFSVSGLNSGVGGLTAFDVDLVWGRGADFTGVGAHGREGAAMADEFIKAGAHSSSLGMATLSPDETESLQVVENCDNPRAAALEASGKG
jgi:hypothetical protein